MGDEALEPEGVENDPSERAARVADVLLHAGEGVGQVGTRSLVAGDGDAPTGWNHSRSDLPALLGRRDF